MNRKEMKKKIEQVQFICGLYLDTLESIKEMDQDEPYWRAFHEGQRKLAQQIKKALA